MNELNESTQQLIKLAITTGRANQSPQTGYIQYCYDTLEEGVQDTIPLMENVLFALALLRTEDSGYRQEANELLTNLLAFQNTSDDATKGNFPVYLHEYPKCKDPFLGAQLLVPFYWILKTEQENLTPLLTIKLTTAARSLLNYSLKVLNIDSTPFQSAIRLAAAAQAFGILWNDTALTQQGEQLLKELNKQSESDSFGSWFSPPYIADTLIALQMVYSEILSSPWKHFWDHLTRTWSSEICSYVGPKIKDFQDQGEPKVSLYDLALGLLSESYPYRAFTQNPYQLHGVLLHPTHDLFRKHDLPLDHKGEVAGLKWHVHQGTKYAYSAIQKGVLPSAELEKGYHAFSLVWGDKTCTHTFVCQGGGSAFIDFNPVENGVDLFFYLPPITQESIRDKAEISFFCDQHEGLKVPLMGVTPPTFQLNDSVIVGDRSFEFSLVFLLQEGDGRFIGYFSPQNRLAQINKKGEHRFKSFDWEFSLRTIRRFTACKIKVEIRFNP